MTTSDETTLETTKTTDLATQPQIEPEILGLETAFEKIKGKIEWHREQIENYKTSISSHNEQINALQQMLKTKFSSLVGEIGNSKEDPKPKSQTKKKGRKSGSGSTSELISSCLQRAGRAVDTKYVIKYLRDHGSETNPSVELNRMKRKGVISQPSRGLYEWIEQKEE